MELPPPLSAELAVSEADLEAAEHDVVVRQADSVDFFPEQGWIHARGNVEVVQGDQILRADLIRIHTRDRLVFAQGNVALIRGDEIWRGDSLRYDFDKGSGSMDGVTGDTGPFRVLESDKFEHTAESRFVLYNARITTCELDHPHTHYHVRARQIEVLPGQHLIVRGARWYFGRVPVMVLPYWHRNLNDRFGFNLQPGYRSREGYFALGSYSYPLGSASKGETHLDYRTRRGWAMGQDFTWRGVSTPWHGDLSFYYAYDKEPGAGMPESHAQGVSPDRSRVRLRHQHTLSDRNTLRLQAHWLSDPYVLEDFFVREYRRRRQPESYAVVTRRGETYVADALVRGRVNRFYDDVQRLPEFSLRLLPREIGESRLYYESQNSWAFLDRVWAEVNTNDAAIALSRFDSGHMFYRPQKLAGFLNVVPRAGYRATWYSKTRGERREHSQDEHGEDVYITVNEDRAAALRSYIQVGGEASFRAYKIWSGGIVSPLRHVFEPYADYTFAPSPSVKTERLYWFDSVDTLAKNHSAKLGVRNKWQTKAGRQSVDIIDADLYTRVHVDPRADQKALDPLYFDVRVRPIYDGWTLNLDGEWDPTETGLEHFNVDSVFNLSEYWRANIELRTRYRQTALLAGNVLFTPGKQWNFGFGGRYDFESERTEEVEGLVARFWDCMALRMRVGYVPGYRQADGQHRDDDWRLALEFWLTAFPDVRLLTR